MIQPGLFISFEGIDGAGKSSHIDALAQFFQAQGRVVTRTREPGGTPLAEKLRALVLGDAMDAMTEALLVFAARRDHLQQVIEPALARCEVVLCDRFTDATFAYQGAGRGFDVSTLSYLEQLVQTTPALEANFVRQPDVTVWFDLAPDIAAQRLAGARLPDKFEAQPVSFFANVRAGYQARHDAQPHRFVRIDADQSRAEVWHDVVQAVAGKLGLTPPATAATVAALTTAEPIATELIATKSEAEKPLAAIPTMALKALPLRPERQGTHAHQLELFPAPIAELASVVL